MTTAILNGAILRAIQTHFVSNEETRYYLCGVHIEPHPQGGVTMVATDGHRLGCYYDKHSSIEGKPVIVKLDKGTLQHCRTVKKEPTRFVRISNGSATVYADKREAELEKAPLAIQPQALIDGTFPDWRRIIPTPCKEMPALAGYNCQYLSQLGKAMGEVAIAADAPKTSTMVIAADDASAPALVRAPAVPNFFAVLMPVKIDAHAAATLPDWFAYPNGKPEAVKAA